MRVIAPQHCRMRHVRHHDVIDVLAVAGQQARIFDPLQILADEFVLLLRGLLLAAGRDVAFAWNVLWKRGGHLRASPINVTA